METHPKFQTYPGERNSCPPPDIIIFFKNLRGGQLLRYFWKIVIDMLKAIRYGQFFFRSVQHYRISQQNFFIWSIDHMPTPEKFDEKNHIDVIFMPSVEAPKVNSKENGKEWKKLKNIFSVFDFLI